VTETDRLGNAVTEIAGIQDTDSGKLGYYVSGAWHVVDPDDPKKFLVRFSNGTHVSAYHLNKVPQKYDLNVLVGKDHIGRPVILGEDRPSNQNYHTSTSGGTSVGWHTHVRGSGLEFIQDEWLWKHLRVTSNSDNFILNISAGSYLYHGELRWKEAGTLNLSSYVPSISTAYKWIIVGINPLTDAFVSAGGSQAILTTPSPDPATLELINFVENGYIPLAAIWLLGGDTGIPSVRIQDLRHSLSSVFWYLGDLINVYDYYDYEDYVLTFKNGIWMARPSQGGNGYHVIQDEGYNLPNRLRLNFVGPNVLAYDDFGGNRTDVSVLEPISQPNSMTGNFTFQDNRSYILASPFELSGTITGGSGTRIVLV